MSKTTARYWAKREETARKHYKQIESGWELKIQDIYGQMNSEIQQKIEAFYQKYADENGLTLADAKKRLTNADMSYLEKVAAEYVANKDFSDQANQEMALYNATMKINRLELLKADIGSTVVKGFNDLQSHMDEKLKERTVQEYKRLAGILGNTVSQNAQYAQQIVDGSFHYAHWSDRLWKEQDHLKNALNSLLSSGLIQGLNPRELAPKLKNEFNTSTYVSTRLMRTELCRVQTEAQTTSYKKLGFDSFKFIPEMKNCCPECRALDGKVFKIEDGKAGVNIPPIHPNCRCSTAPVQSDGKDFEDWVDSLGKGNRMKYENWIAKGKPEPGTKTAAKKTTKAKAQPQNGPTEADLRAFAKFPNGMDNEERFKRLSSLQKKFASMKLEEKQPITINWYGRQVTLTKLDNVGKVFKQDYNQFKKGKLKYLDDETRKSYERLMEAEKEWKRIDSNNKKYRDLEGKIYKLRPSDKAVNSKINVSRIYEQLGASTDNVIDLLEKGEKRFQKLWNKHADMLSVKSTTEKKTAYYSPANKGIYINLEEARTGNIHETPFAVFFHEMGHHIDDVSVNGMKYGNKASYLYGQQKLFKALQKDYRDGFKAWQNGSSGTVEDYMAYLKDKYQKKYGDEVLKYVTDVSDMLEAQSGVSRPLGIGHGAAYFRRNREGTASTEAFAEMTAANLAQPQSMEVIKELFPTALSVYDEIVDQLTKDYKDD